MRSLKMNPALSLAYHWFLSGAVTKADTLPNKGEIVLPDLDGYSDEEREVFVEVALVKRQVDSYGKQVEALKETRKAGGIVAPQVLQNLEDSLKCYERLHLSLRMRIHDIQLKHRHDPK